MKRRKQKLKLYHVEIYDTRLGHAWIWAKNVDEAYDKAREFESQGKFKGVERLESDLGIEEETCPKDVKPDSILNKEEANDCSGNNGQTEKEHTHD